MTFAVLNEWRKYTGYGIIKNYRWQFDTIIKEIEKLADLKLIISKSDVFLSMILAFLFSASPYYIRKGVCPLNLEFFIACTFMFLAFLLLNVVIRAFLYGYFSLANQRFQKCRFSAKVQVFLDSRYIVFKIAGIIFLCWLPILLFLYPGTLINDTWGQLQQFIGWIKAGDLFVKGFLDDHHPIFDTFFMGALIVPVAKLTGNWHAAIFLYVMVQACMTSFSFSYSLLYLRKKLGLDEVCVLFLLSIYCIVPLYAASVQTVSKDALFSWIYVLFFVYFIEIVRTNGEALQDRNFFYKILLLSVFCALTKKVGMYVVIFSFVALWLAKLDNKRKIKTVIITIIILMAGVMPLVRHILGAGSGGIQEMYSIPFQQTARYVKYYSKDVLPSEKAVLSKVLIYNKLAKQYNPLSADPVKGYSKRGRTIEYIIYFKVWGAQLLRHPYTYVEAFQAMLSGWFSFSEYDPLMNMNWHNQLNKSLIPAWVPVRPEYAKKTADAVQNAYHALYHAPIWGFFLSYGLYAALLPAFALSTVLRKWNGLHAKYYLVTVPVLLSLALGCWLAPVSIHFEGRRYLYPLTYTAPLLLAWCMYIYQQELQKIKN